MAKKLQEAQDNPYLRDVVNAQIKANNLLLLAGPMASSEKVSSKRGCSSSRETSMFGKRKSLHPPKHGSPHHLRNVIPYQECMHNERELVRTREGSTLTLRLFQEDDAHEDLQCDMTRDVAIIVQTIPLPTKKNFVLCSL